MHNRNIVVYIPYYESGAQTNRYIIHMIKILKGKYVVEGRLAEPLEILRLLKTKAVFLNWEEDCLDMKKKVQLCFYKLFGAKIIWVFHNRMPHGAMNGNNDSRRNMVWLADKASHIVLHSKSSRCYIPHFHKNKHKGIYIPHIKYGSSQPKAQMAALRDKYQIGEHDFVFAMVGFIKPYKHFEDGIRAFAKLNVKNAKLILAGSSENGEYTRYLKKLSSGNPNIILDFRYIPDMILDAVLGISDVVVIPYMNRSSMNSGVMMQAFSDRKTVIVPNICMARDFASQGFLYRYGKSLENTMRTAYLNGKQVNREMGMRAYAHVLQYHSEKMVAEKLFGMLGD